ncbi:MAG: hypothetical protein HYU84_08345, partial [Chloroflexi bacterium]|nr:hypothetical protein [Chloroflexota bacterium]
SGGGGGDEGEGSSKKKSPGRIAYEKKMQQKHIIGELQAAAKTSQAKPVNQLAKIDTDEERLEAYKQTAGYQARQQSYAEYERQKAMEAQRAGERNASDRSKPKAAEGRIEKERQYDLTSWMPLVINRNLDSPELADMRFYNVLMQPGNLPTVKTYPSSAFGPWITELLGNFRTLNTGGGKWDIKLEMQEEFRSGPGEKDAAHILCSNSGTCKWVDYSTAGNILYGTTAADVGVPREMSKLAGGLLEVWEGTAKWENRSNWFEDPYDTNAVNFGYDLYESTGGNITEEAFRNALTDDFLNSLQPPSEGFEPPFEARPQPNTYPADRFDHQPEGQ